MMMDVFAVITVNRMFWLRMLERLYPELEFVRSCSVRSTVDTIRNQGIITILLQVRGSCDIHLFRSRLQVQPADLTAKVQVLLLEKSLTPGWVLPVQVNKVAASTRNSKFKTVINRW